MNEITYKELKLNLDLKSCFISNEEIRLTKNEYFLLEFLLKNKNKVFTRREILKGIGDINVSLRSVDSMISRLKKKLKEYNNIIKTKLGIGYGILVS